jgi:adenylate cyclase
VATERVERRLTAILSADVAGYSRLTGLDEEGTHVRLKEHLRVLVDPKITEHHGRVVKNTGDGMLAEFGSVVDSLRCAVDVQRGMAERNAEVPRDKRIEFRIGINVGDIIIDGGDIFGDGVNVAARLEGLAHPGGICVSHRVREDTPGKLDVVFEDMGDHHLKNIAQPVRLYSVALRTSVKVLPSGPLVLGLPDKPSIAVLPFNVMQGDKGDEDFADGLTEDIITALSRISALFVIARNSTFIYKGKAIEIRQVGNELGVRYVMEGSVRRSGVRIRISAQLIEAATGHHVWAEKYDCDPTDIFGVQDEISKNIAAAIQTEVRLHEGLISEYSRADPTVHDLVNKAFKSMYKLTKMGFAEARTSINQAFARTSDDPRLNQIAATVEFHEFWLGYSQDHTQLERGLSFAEKAVSLNPIDEYSCWIFGLLAAFTGQHDIGIGSLRRAIELNPNFSLGHGSLATILAFAGMSDESIRENEISLRLNPRDPSNFFRHYGLALAHFVAGQYAEAARWARRAAGGKPDWPVAHVILIASLRQHNRIDEAAAALKNYLVNFPNSRISDFWWLPIKLPAHRDDLTEGLRKAGLP